MMKSKKQLCDSITLTVATQLHNFDFSRDRATETFEQVQKRLDVNEVIKRYRNDFIFHAKVCSMVAAIMHNIADAEADQS